MVVAIIVPGFVLVYVWHWLLRRIGRAVPRKPNVFAVQPPHLVGTVYTRKLLHCVGGGNKVQLTPVLEAIKAFVSGLDLL
jgi:hypothetical protein